MKNVEISLLNMFPKNIGIIKNMYLIGVLDKEEYNEVLKTGDELINVIVNLEVRMKATNTLGSYSENSKKVERLLEFHKKAHDFSHWDELIK